MYTLSSLLLGNEILDAEMEAFCASDPEYVRMKEEFYETAEEIAQLVGFDAYDSFEKRFSNYLYRTADLYYLFGLNLRQELLHALKG